MNPDAPLLAALPTYAFAFVILLSRFGALIMVMPGLGEAQLPVTIRAALAVAVALLMLPLLAPTLPPMPPAPAGVLFMVAAELVAGLFMGWLTRLVALALPAAAQIVSFMIGLSSVLSPDPMLGQSGLLARLFGMVPALLVLGTGLYALPLASLADSYRLIPAGTILPARDSAQLMVSGVAGSFSLAVRLAAPFILAGTLWQITLGIGARLVPSLQVYFLAMPGQVLGGILLLAITLPLMLAAWTEAARGGLSPFGH